MTDEAVIEATRVWLRDVVVGWNLCPYARGPVEGGRARLALAHGGLEARLSSLVLEIERLIESSERSIETTLLVVPDAPADFEAFLDEHELALDLAERWSGEIQVVAFHPRFCFDGAAPDDSGNLTNRSPAPMWHLLRERSISRVVRADPDGVAAIPGRNQAFLVGKTV